MKFYRCDSYLAQLGPGQVARLRELLLTPSLTLEQVREQCPRISPRRRASSYRGKSKPNLTVLGKLRERFFLEDQEARNRDAYQSIEKMVKQADPNLSPEQIARFALEFFAGKAIRLQDPKSFTQIYRLTLEASRIENERRKLKFLEDRETKIKKAMDAPEMTPEQRDQAVRKILGLP